MGSKKPKGSSGGAGCSVYSLFIVNFLIWAMGAAVFSFGIVSLLQHQKSNDFIAVMESDDKVFCAGLISVGIFQQIVAIAGIYGVARKHRGILLGYAFTLVICCVLKATIGTMCFIYRNKLDFTVRRGMHNTLNTFDDKNHASQAWNDIQKSYKCCGVLKATEFHAASTEWHKINPTEYPASCCSRKPVNSTTCTEPHSKGCYYKVLRDMKQNWGVVIGITAAFAVIQMIGIGCSFYHQWMMKKTTHYRPL